MTLSEKQDTPPPPPPDYPWRYRALVFTCAMMLCVGNHFAAHTLSTLKSRVRKDLDISNENYGTLQASLSIAGTLLPILGGFFVDTFGTIWGSVLSSGFIALGTIIQALSTNLKSFPLMVVGSVVYGIGGGTIMIVQDVMLTRWFSGYYLAVTIGFQVATGRLASFIAMLTVVPFADYMGSYSWSYWLSAFLCFLSFLFTIVYIVFLWKIRANDISEFNQSISEKRRFHVSMMLRFASPMWWILGMCLTLGGGWATYLHVVPDLFKTRFKKDETTAAAITAMTQVFPIVFAPFTGFLIEKYKAHNLVIFQSALLFLVANVVLFFTNVTPILSSLIFSLSLAIGPVAMMSLIPMTLPLYSVGTGIGIYKSGHNIGSTIYDIITGVAQDLQGFESVLVLMVIIAVFGVLCSLVLASRKRVYYEQEPALIKEPKWWSWLWVSILCVGLLTSLATFVVSLVRYAL